MSPLTSDYHLINALPISSLPSASGEGMLWTFWPVIILMHGQQPHIFVSTPPCMFERWRKRFRLGCRLSGVCDAATSKLRSIIYLWEYMDEVYLTRSVVRHFVSSRRCAQIHCKHVPQHFSLQPLLRV